MGNKVPYPNLDKFLQEQINFLIKNPKTHEFVERLSYQKEISKERALDAIMDKMLKYLNAARPKITLR